MRSAVSSILSEPSDQSPMAFPDYEQTVWDQRSMLVLVNSIGPRLSEEKFQEIFDQISTVNEISADISGNRDTPTLAAQELGNKRTFLIRYSKNYPVENNEWGDFQKHRQVLGIISIGGYSSVQELEEIKRLHHLSKTKYSGSVVDSRLIVLGLHDDQQETGDVVDNVTSAEENETGSHADNLANVESRTLFYQDHTFQQDLSESSNNNHSLQGRLIWKDDVVDFLSGIFWILESKRREEVQREGKQDRMNLLCTPFEKKDFVGLDLDSRANKKRIYGRYQKYLGDLNMICDRIIEAYEHYQLATDALRSCNDWIWLAGAMEGLCAISVMLHYPSSRKSINPLTPDPASINNIDILKPRDIVERYKEIVVHYSKYRLAGVIETEASIKAVQVLIEQRNFVLAAEFLQNLVFINLNMNDEEKIHRFSALANLYSRIGFHRKAAFFLRVSAMRCVAPQNPHPDWKMCHKLLMKATPGYSLDIHEKKPNKNAIIGWPALQIQLIQEMVGTARRMGNYEMAVLHMVHLLEGMFHFLSKAELTDISRQLEVLVSRSKDSTQQSSSLRSAKNEMIAFNSTNLQKIPNVSAFNLCPLPSHLIPRMKVIDKNPVESVFVFTPRQFGGEKSNKTSKVPFCWVENDVAEVSLMLSNPLPIEIKIVNLVLMHQGTIAFEAFPTTFALRSGNEPLSVNLLGVPKEAGELTITGYECTVLGIPCKVQLKSLSNNFPSDGFTVQVVSSLPQVQVTLNKLQPQIPVLATENETASSEEGHNSLTSTGSLNISERALDPEEGGSTLIFYGEEASFELTLTNISTIQARIMNVTWTSNCLLEESVCTIHDDTNISLLSKDTKKIRFTIVGRPPTKNENRSKKSNKMVNNAITSYATTPDSSCETIESGDDVEFKFKITYSADKTSLNQNYNYREVVKTFNVTIMPSASVTKWDVLPSESSDKNFLVLDIMNCCQYELDLLYADSKNLVIEPCDVCRIPLPIDRFALPDTDKCTNDIQKSCVDIIKQQINVQWRINMDEETKFGNVLLDNIRLSDKMIENLELLPTNWNVFINDTEASSLEGDANFPVGKAIKVKVMLESGFPDPFQGQINVEFFVHGRNINVPDTCVITEKESRLQLCNPNSTIQHSTIILPLIQGKFEIECSCKIEQRTSRISGNIFSNVTKFPPIPIMIK